MKRGLLVFLLVLATPVGVAWLIYRNVQWERGRKDERELHEWAQ